MNFLPPQLSSRSSSPVPVFSDAALQDQFDMEGITRFPFLSPDEVKELLLFYHSLTKDTFGGFHATLFRQDESYRKKVDEKLKDSLSSKLEQLFPGFVPLYGSFMVKEPSPESAMKIHQDWSYVNENHSLSFAVWFPLTDVTEQNGAVKFMKGSHRYSLSVRGPGILCPFEKESKWIEENALTSYPLKAGEAIAWHHRLVHGSPPNRSAEARIAATVIMVPRGRQVIHFYHDPTQPETEVEVYAVNSGFFMNYKIGSKPENMPLIGKFQYPLQSLGIEELKKMLTERRNEANKNGILEWIVNWFRK